MLDNSSYPVSIIEMSSLPFYVDYHEQFNFWLHFILPNDCVLENTSG